MVKLFHPERAKYPYEDLWTPYLDEVFSVRSFNTSLDSMDKLNMETLALSAYSELPSFHTYKYNGCVWNSIRKVHNLLLEEKPLSRVTPADLAMAVVGNFEVFPEIDVPYLAQVCSAVCLLESQRIFGNPIYVVAEEMETVLKNITLEGLKLERFKLPFSSLFLQLPSDFQMELSSGGVFSRHTLEGAYISEKVMDKGFVGWELGLVRQNCEFLNEFSIHTLDIIETETVSKCLDTYTRQLLNLTGASSLQNMEQTQKDIQDIFNYIFNALLYITAMDADVIFSKESKEYLELKEKMNQAKGKRKNYFKKIVKDMDEHPRYTVGNTITIDRKVEKKPSESTGSSGRTMKVQTIVAGHWHNYWVGSKGTQKKVAKLIKPYIKGPADAPFSTNKKYRLV